MPPCKGVEISEKLLDSRVVFSWHGIRVTVDADISTLGLLLAEGFWCFGALKLFGEVIALAALALLILAR